MIERNNMFPEIEICSDLTELLYEITRDNENVDNMYLKKQGYPKHAKCVCSLGTFDP